MQTEPTEEEVQIEAMTTRFADVRFVNEPTLDKDWVAPWWSDMDISCPAKDENEVEWIPPVEMCGRCYTEFDTTGNLESSRCNEKPERLIGQPIGQYHCPDCGAMVLAGIPHPTVCHRCATRTHPSFD